MTAHKPVRGAMLGVVLIQLACGSMEPGDASTSGGPDSTGGATDDAPTSGDTDAITGAVPACGEPRPATDDCCCFEGVTDEDNSFFVKNSCPPGASTCGAITMECTESFGNDGSCSSDAFTIADTEAADVACVLDALRAGAPGVVGWGNVAVPGFAGHDTTVYITGLEDVIRTSQGYVDLSKSVGPIERFDLPPAAFFDECEALPTTIERFKCLKGFLDGAPGSTCTLQ